MSKPWQADVRSAKELPQHLLYDSSKVQILKQAPEIPEQRLREIRLKEDILNVCLGLDLITRVK